MAKRKHLIIGGGTCGLSAAEQIRRLNAEDEIKIVTAEERFPYSPTVLPYLLSRGMEKTNLSMRREDYFNHINTALVQGKEVSAVLPKTKEVVFKDGEREKYDTLLIASGADSSCPPIEGLNEKTYLGFHTIDDCEEMLRRLEGKEEVVVLGAGLVGIEVAIGLVERGCRVTVIEKESTVLSLYFDLEAARLIDVILVKQGIQVLTGKEVTGIREKAGKKEIDLSDGSSVSTDVLVTCTGVAPRIAFLNGSGIAMKQGILVDHRMMTNIQDIYAAGDVAEAPGFFNSTLGLNQTIMTAVEEGLVAGSNMAGENTAYEGWISSNIFNFFGNTAIAVGLSMPSDNSYQVFSDKDEAKPQYRKLVYEGNKLVGAMFLNVDIDSGVILYLIRKGADINGYKERMFEETKEISRWLMLDTERREAASIHG